MKFFSVVLLILIQHISSYAQHADKLIVDENGYIDIDNQEGYVVKFIGDGFPFYKRIHCIISDSTGEVREKFFRYSDTCFAYVQFDSNQNEILKGFVCINSERKKFDTIQAPDIEKDPDLSKGIMKDLIFAQSCFDKTGMWEEVEQQKIVRRGMYKEGKKNGIWKVGHFEGHDPHPDYNYLPKRIFKLDSTERYNDGKPDADYKPDFSFDAVWEKLKGSWLLAQFDSPYPFQLMYVKNSSTNNSTLTFENINYLTKGSDKKSNGRWTKIRLA